MIEKVIIGLTSALLILFFIFMIQLIYNHFDYEVAKRMYNQAHIAFSKYEKTNDEDVRNDLRAQISGIISVFSSKKNFIQLLDNKEQKEIEEMIPAFFPSSLVE